jgi:hypothetical protein
MRQIAFILFAAATLILSGCKKEKEELSFNDIISLVEKEHKNVVTYRDNSTATMNYITSNPFTVVKESKVVYSNDGRFRFEYYEVGKDNSEYIIHRDAAMNVKSWYGITGVLKDEDNLEIALASATGVSDMTAFIVPTLLLPDEFQGHNIFKTLTSLARGEDEIINGKDCYLITGYNNADDLCSIYILKDSYLIKRFTSSHQFDTFDFSRVIDFNPEMNISIPDAEFIFGTI